MFWEVDDPSRYVYHYTTWPTALGAILPTGQIRFGLARYMNDPRESRDWWFSLVGDEDVGDIRDITGEASRLLKATTKLVCLTRDDPTYPADDVFGRGYAHAAMWAHYGGGHSGVCLVFERELLSEEIRMVASATDHRLYAGAVSYEDFASDEINAFSLLTKRIDQVGLEAAVEEHFHTYHPILFFRKNVDWMDELEYRWLMKGGDPTPVFVRIGASLRGIIVGETFPRSDTDSLKHVASQFEIPPHVASCLWTNGYPRILPWGKGGTASFNGTRFWPKGATPPAPPPSLEVDLAPLDGTADEPDNSDDATAE